MSNQPAKTSTNAASGIVRLDASKLQEEEDELAREECEILAEEKKIEAHTKTIQTIGWGLVAIGVLVSIPGLAWFFLGDWDNPHELGDFLGGTVASCWGLAGLMFIYVAFLGQCRQALLQRLDVKNNRFEVKQTRLELQTQNEMMQQQIFEQTFFQLLRSYNDIVNSIDVQYASSKEQSEKRGRDCFELLYERFKSQCEPGINLDQTKQLYFSFFADNRADLEHYFGHITQTLKYLTSAPESFDSQKYASFLDGQLSTFEKALAFYHGCSIADEFFDLACNFKILDSLPEDVLLSRTHQQEALEQLAMRTNAP